MAAIIHPTFVHVFSTFIFQRYTLHVLLNDFTAHQSSFRTLKIWQVYFYRSSQHLNAILMSLKYFGLHFPSIYLFNKGKPQIWASISRNFQPTLHVSLNYFLNHYLQDRFLVFWTCQSVWSISLVFTTSYPAKWRARATTTYKWMKKFILLNNYLQDRFLVFMAGLFHLFIPFKALKDKL